MKMRNMVAATPLTLFFFLLLLVTPHLVSVADAAADVHVKTAIPGVKPHKPYNKEAARKSQRKPGTPKKLHEPVIKIVIPPADPIIPPVPLPVVPPVVIPPQPMPVVPPVVIPPQPVPVVIPPQPMPVVPPVVIPPQPMPVVPPVVIPPQPMPVVPPVVIPPQPMPVGPPVVIPPQPVIQMPIKPAAPRRGRRRPPPAGITYHGGPMLSGEINLSLLFYGQWSPRGKELIRSFINSFGIPGSAFERWRLMVESYARKPISIRIGGEMSDDNASMGKIVNIDFLKMLVRQANSARPNTVAVILAHKDVGTQHLCRGKCYDHGSFDGVLPYLFVANPEVECPGACGMPFAPARFGPPGQVVRPPNGELGIDATAVHLAAGLASVLTNPFRTGFWKPGPKTWQIEAGNACENNFGRLNVDPAGAGFNAIGERNLAFVLPAIWDPTANACWAPL